MLKFKSSRDQCFNKIPLDTYALFVFAVKYFQNVNFLNILHLKTFLDVQYDKKFQVQTSKTMPPQP